MSILIKGMEMPTSCADCPIGDTLCCPLMPGVPALWAEYASAVKEKRLHSDCPLVPVPPHGDLIDRDEQIERAWRLNLSTRELIEEMLKSAPTIIPASEEGDVL